MPFCLLSHPRLSQVCAYAAAQAQQEALYKQQDRLYKRQEELAAKQRDELKAALLAQNQAAQKERETALSASVAANNQAADKSLKEAYIAYMLAQKNLPQQLKALGISGGHSETTAADMNNRYLNSRYGIEESRNAANTQARQSYDSAINRDYADYLAAVSDVDTAYANRLYALMADHNNTLMDRAATAAANGQSLAAALNAAAKSRSKASAPQPQQKTGYQIARLGITAADEVDLYKKLIDYGFTQSAAEQYMINQGLVKNTSAGGSER